MMTLNQFIGIKCNKITSSFIKIDMCVVANNRYQNFGELPIKFRIDRYRHRIIPIMCSDIKNFVANPFPMYEDVIEGLPVLHGDDLIDVHFDDINEDFIGHDKRKESDNAFSDEIFYPPCTVNLDNHLEEIAAIVDNIYLYNLEYYYESRFGYKAKPSDFSDDAIAIVIQCHKASEVELKAIQKNNSMKAKILDQEDNAVYGTKEDREKAIIAVREFMSSGFNTDRNTDGQQTNLYMLNDYILVPVSTDRYKDISFNICGSNMMSTFYDAANTEVHEFLLFQGNRHDDIIYNILFLDDGTKNDCIIVDAHMQQL